MFGQVLWRTIVVAIGGGAGIGFLIGLFGVAISLFSDDDDLSGGIIGFPFLAAYIAAVFGLFLGVVAGLLLATLAAVTLVPYRGSRPTILTIRITAVVLVGLFMMLLFLDAVDAEILVGAIVGAGLLGAWFLSPFLVRWYVRRMEPASR